MIDAWKKLYGKSSAEKRHDNLDAGKNHREKAEALKRHNDPDVLKSQQPSAVVKDNHIDGGETHALRQADIEMHVVQ